MKNMDPNAYAIEKAALILKHLRGELSAGEERELREWMDAREENRRFVESFEEEGALKEDLTILANARVSDAWQNVRARTTKKARSVLFPILRAAAAILIVLVSGVGLYFAVTSESASIAHVEVISEAKPDLPPGGNKAVLELADGSTIVLDDAVDGQVHAAGGTQINKRDNTLIYRGDNRAVTEIAFNKVSTPTGGQFRIVLPDGTKVWLNALSSLRYPTTFTGPRRQVEMTGEVYFEVAHNASAPFRVTVNDMWIDVLGTHFNVMAYTNEPSMEATLVEGSVNVSRNGHTANISPGQQARVADDIQVIKANVDETLAWKEGFFHFHGTNLKGILRQLERWYGADVDYTHIPMMHFTGSISRDNNLSEVLKMLELTGGIRFDIDEGGKILINEDRPVQKIN